MRSWVMPILLRYSPRPFFHADAREGDEHVRHGRVILGVADVGEREELALEAVERGVDERARDLAGAVGAVVEEDDRVVVGDHAVLVADDGSTNSSVTPFL